MEISLSSPQPLATMQNDRTINPSPRVRQKKRKSGDHLVMTPHLSFVCDKGSVDEQEAFIQYQQAANALRELKKQQNMHPIPREVAFEPVHDAPVANKKGRMVRRSSVPPSNASLGSYSNASLGSQSNEKFIVAPQQMTVSQVSVSHMHLQNRINVSASAPSLQALAAPHRQQQSEMMNPYANTNPDMYLHKILRDLGASNVRTRPSLDIKGYFFEASEVNVTSYGPDIISAVRQGDIATLRHMHREGRMLQCCNRFGESIVHMACRRGAFDVVRFLLYEAGVNVRLRDDFGRTPLHDACWTREPEIELVKMLITVCPDMLLMTDKRGSTPLAYVRKGHWGQWCEFLNANHHLLKPAPKL